MQKDILLLYKMLINDKEIKKNYFNKIYPFTNENIKDYYKNIDFNDKNVLSVVGSGDHILNAYLSGAKSVDAFDVNPLSKYYSELKIAGIKTFAIDDFVTFFYKIDDNKYMNLNKYHFLRSNLRDEYKLFWDYYIKLLNFNLINLKKEIYDKLFNYDIPNIKDVIKSNKYLSNYEDYYKLRNILKDKITTYYDLNVFDLDKINKKYDIILLSNIAAYLDLYYEDDYVYLKKLRDAIESVSDMNSVVVLSYLYSELINRKNALGIYNSYRTNKYFSSDKYEYIKVNKTNKIKQLLYGKDKIIVSKKTHE